MDSGSYCCLFHASIGDALGMRPEDGPEGDLGGVVGGSKGKAYYHKMKLILCGSMISITAGFSRTLSVAAILGRAGFFDNFNVTFDSDSNPPGLVIERINKA